MDNQNRKLELLGNAPIPKALLAMGIPTMIGMLINALYNLVDAYFVGGLGESQMAAISVVYPLGQVVVGLGLLFGNGAASYISRLLGQRNKDQANKVASTALYSSLVVGAIMIVLSIIFLKPILRLLGATESVLPYAATYAGIYIISCIFNNNNLGMVRQWQKLFYGKRYSMTCLRSGAACRGKCGEVECPTYTPDFMKLADSYGAKGIHITKKEDIEPAFREAMKSTKTPYILEFDIDPEDLVYPMVKPGGTLEDLIMDC